MLDKFVAGTVARPLYLFGDTGTGKTLGALALCDIIETAAYWEADRFSSFVMYRSDELDSELHRLSEKELLVIDEIGTRTKATDLGCGALKMLLDVREQNGGATIIIGNIRPEEIEGLYDARIASRVLCGSIFELNGEDRREAGR